MKYFPKEIAAKIFDRKMMGFDPEQVEDYLVALAAQMEALLQENTYLKSTLKDKEMTKYRRDDVGFVFQSYNLINNLTALENVEMATQICKDAKNPQEVLAQVGLQDRMNNFPSQLSGGEQQRVAIARAIAKNPKILLCDEPTGALDTETGQQVLRVLRECSDVYNMTVIIITHNQNITQMADRIIEIKNGRIKSDSLNISIRTVDEISW